MRIQCILTFTLLALASIEPKKGEERFNFLNLTANGYLKRRYDFSYATAAHLLDLDGSLRQRFLYAVTSNEENTISTVCSPFSALVPLGMLVLGAGHENTDRNLRNVIGIHMETEAPEYFRDLLNGIQNVPKAHTYIANRIYISDKKKLKDYFVKAAEDIFDSGIQSINMKDGNKVAKEVNKWVRKNTRGKIDKILQPSDVDPDTVTFLANAIYFSAKWVNPFKHSEEDVFYGVNGHQKVNMMQNTDYYLYGTSHVLGAQAIQIPYKGDAASMLVLLPHAKHGLHSLLLKLKKAPDLINTIEMDSTYVDLQLPSFKIETTLDLKYLYEKIGLTEVFRKGHGLHDIVEDSPLFISKGIQKAFIEVTQVGTVAAAASVLNFQKLSMNFDKPVKFRADHPFLFFIIANRQQLSILASKSMLFTSTCSQPLSKMKIQFILTFPLIALASAELGKINKTVVCVNSTVNDYLRTRHEGATHLLDLDGTMRQKFLYTVLSNEKNVISAVCSPFSAMMPLGVLELGAGNEKTDRNLREALGINKKTAVATYFKNLLNGIQNMPKARTFIANRIYISDRNKLKGNFVNAAKNIFDSGIQSINMQDGENVANEVNSWVRKNTKGKIDQILQPSDVDPFTIVLVANAIYFKAKWMNPLKHSEEDVFYGVNGQQKVNMMYQRDFYMYGTSRVLNAAAILIPYEDNAAAMLVLLPNAKDGLQSLLLQLKRNPDLINTISMKMTNVNFWLPSFKIETTFDLKHFYKKVGITEILREGNGLHDMVEENGIFIDKGIQKAFIEVTKDGTVAAAASVVHGMAMSMQMAKPVPFKADHPFLFMIIAQKQQLFGGTFAGEKRT
ncbi:serpin (serine protease inhibitor) domain-containing protein [Phthorimaea operculella]|nr:serpin (serine protease inhibitor) domain-containing protein [Phthorimaea operculella]